MLRLAIVGDIVLILGILECCWEVYLVLHFVVNSEFFRPIDDLIFVSE